jgi:hypothetical protein
MSRQSDDDVFVHFRQSRQVAFAACKEAKQSHLTSPRAQRLPGRKRPTCLTDDTNNLLGVFQTENFCTGNAVYPNCLSMVMWTGLLFPRCPHCVNFPARHPRTFRCARPAFPIAAGAARQQAPAPGIWRFRSSPPNAPSQAWGPCGFSFRFDLGFSFVLDLGPEVILCAPSAF